MESPATPPPEETARRAGLRYASDDRPGLSRRRRGRGFSYHRPDGALVTDPDERARLDALAIPPAYTGVWIAPEPDAHLLATGRDEQGRKQYRYHPAFEAARQRQKFDRLVAFAEALPGLRARVEDDLRRRRLDRDRVTALAVRLLDETLIRVGNAEYVRQNGHFGLTTLRDRHAAVEGAEVTFTFVGKSGKEHAVSLQDRRLARLVRACRDVPGYHLFQYLDDEGGRGTLDSGDVNAYLRETTGEAFTAKSFRTWGGTVLAAQALAACGLAADERACERNVLGTYRDVAAQLGNTVAVCRSYYVHPDVVGAYRAGTLLDALKRRNRGNTPAGLEPVEAAVIALLKGG